MFIAGVFDIDVISLRNITLLTYWICWLKVLAINRAGHPVDLDCMLASLGLVLPGSKRHRVDELTRNGPIYYLHWKTDRQAASL